MRAKTDHDWGVILAGGEGSRLQEFTKHLYGTVRPKQFCVFAGTRSMFRHTVDRTRMLIPSQRLLTVVCKQHLEFALDQVKDVEARNVVLLPFCKETAASVLYSLLLISGRDPDAVVALFPSDHFVRDEREFMKHVLAAFDCARRFQGDLVILGVDAGYPETEYGWIELADRIDWEGGAALFRVRRFWEKPHEELADALLSRKCLWNTLVTVGSVRTFLSLFHIHVPQLFVPFNEIAPLLGTPLEAQAVEGVFRKIPSLNFSSALLQRIPHRLNALRVRDVEWSDWGSKRRILGDVERLHLRGGILQPETNRVASAGIQSVGINPVNT